MPFAPKIASLAVLLGILKPIAVFCRFSPFENRKVAQWLLFKSKIHTNNAIHNFYFTFING